MEKRKNAILILATQPSNMGDLLINKSLTDNLLKYVNLYIDDKRVPKEFSSILFPSGVQSLSQYGISLKGVSGFNFLFFNKVKFDYLFFSPGPSGGVSGIKSIIRSLLILVLFLIIRLKGIKIFHVGVDMNYYSLFDKIIYKIKTSLLGVKYFVRSKNNLANIKGMNIKNVEHIPDLAFSHERNVDPSIVKTQIGISFRDFENSEDNKYIVDRISEVVKFYSKKKKELVFFYQVRSDKQFTYKLYKKYKDYANVTFREEVLWYADIPEYNNFETVFSNRLHVLLLGFDYDAIPIALLNSNRKLSKIYNIFNDLEMNNFILDLDKNHEDVYQYIDKNKVELIKTQQEKFEKQQLLSDSIFKQILT